MERELMIEMSESSVNFVLVYYGFDDPDSAVLRLDSLVDSSSHWKRFVFVTLNIVTVKDCLNDRHLHMQRFHKKSAK
jgi:hypothetical protein